MNSCVLDAPASLQWRYSQEVNARNWPFSFDLIEAAWLLWSFLSHENTIKAAAYLACISEKDRFDIVRKCLERLLCAATAPSSAVEQLIWHSFLLRTQLLHASFSTLALPECKIEVILPVFIEPVTHGESKIDEQVVSRISVHVLEDWNWTKQFSSALAQRRQQQDVEMFFQTILAKYERFLIAHSKISTDEELPFLQHIDVLTDLMWHAHQLTPNMYAIDCKRLCGRIVLHRPWPNGNATSAARIPPFASSSIDRPQWPNLTWHVATTHKNCCVKFGTLLTVGVCHHLATTRENCCVKFGTLLTVGVCRHIGY